MDLIASKENGLKLTSLKLLITECRYIPGENGYICSTNCSMNLCAFGLHEAKGDYNHHNIDATAP